MMTQPCLGHPHLPQQTDIHNTHPRLLSPSLNNNPSNNHMRLNNSNHSRRTLRRLDVRIQVAVMDGARPA